MLAVIAVAIVLGAIASLLTYVHVMWCIPRLPRNLLGYTLSVPTACLPVVAGLLLSVQAERIVDLSTPNVRVIFLLIWMGMGILSMFLWLYPETERRKKAGKYWKCKMP